MTKVYRHYRLHVLKKSDTVFFNFWSFKVVENSNFAGYSDLETFSLTTLTCKPESGQSCTKYCSCSI